MIATLVLLAVVAYIVARAVARHRRRTALVARAAAREWTHLDQDDSLVGTHAGWPFDQGRNRRARDVVRGRYEGREFVAFDHSYETDRHDGDRTADRHEHAVVVLLHPRALPAVLAASVSTRRQRLPGFVGRDLEVGDPAFDPAFQISADDPAAARAVLGPAVRAAMLRRTDLTWRFEPHAVLTIRPGRHEAEEIEAVLDVMRSVSAALEVPVETSPREEEQA